MGYAAQTSAKHFSHEPLNVTLQSQSHCSQTSVTADLTSY